MTWLTEPKRVSSRMREALVAIDLMLRRELASYPVTIELHDPPEHVTLATVEQYDATLRQ